MNLRQPYEQLIADKLRHLPAPDAASSWQQMKRLLDDDEDTRGGGRKRFPGNGWWRIGMLAVVLSASFWIYQESATPDTRVTANKNTTSAPAQANDNTPATTGKSNKNQTTAIDNTTTLKIATDNNTTHTNAATTAIKNSHASGRTPETTAISGTDNAVKKNPANKTGDNTIDDLTVYNPAAVTPQMRQEKNGTPSIGAGTGTSTGKNKTGQGLTDRSGAIQNPATVGATGSQSGKGQYNKFRSTTGHYTSKIIPSGGDRDNNGVNSDEAPTNGSNTAGGSYYAPASLQPVEASEKTWLERLTGLTIPATAPVFNTSLATGDSLASNRDVSNLLSNETKKSIAKAQRDKEIAILDKKDKKFHLNLSNVFKPFSMRIDNEPWWAAGIAINGTVTVGPQNRFNYNMNGKSSTLSDYIPSPYLQFHLNDYVYFQTELNFVSPQYTPQLLVYRGTNDASVLGSSTPPMSQQKSIYVQKMYYFNWPVSLHYSPVKNLFFSGGLQFSSFQSGLATIEEKKYETALGPDHSTSVVSNILKFKDDSIAAKIAPNEWRWQVGAEYYVNRFSVGLRYNQSLKKSINTTVIPGLPPTVNRNQSLLFFIRYNLFESRNKKNDGDKD